MDSINDAYPRQLTNNGVTNDTYDTNEIQIEKTYENVTEMQENLDAKLKYIQEQLKHKDNSPTRMLESRQLVNTLLIILVMCVVYYAFIEL
jgi:CII-binding regulator of phage lambda lysogenization HflD